MVTSDSARAVYIVHEADFGASYFIISPKVIYFDLVTSYPSISIYYFYKLSINSLGFLK